MRKTGYSTTSVSVGCRPGEVKVTPRWYAHRSKSRDTRPGRWTSYTISSPLGPHFRRASSRLMNQCAFKRDRRYLLALLTGGGAAVQLPRRRCCGDIGRGRPTSGVPGDGPRRPGHGVRAFDRVAGRRSSRGSTSAAPMLWRCWKDSGERWGSLAAGSQ